MEYFTALRILGVLPTHLIPDVFGECKLVLFPTFDILFVCLFFSSQIIQSIVRFQSVCGVPNWPWTLRFLNEYFKVNLAFHMCVKGVGSLSLFLINQSKPQFLYLTNTRDNFMVTDLAACRSAGRNGLQSVCTLIVLIRYPGESVCHDGYSDFTEEEVEIDLSKALEASKLGIGLLTLYYLHYIMMSSSLGILF